MLKLALIAQYGTLVIFSLINFLLLFCFVIKVVSSIAPMGLRPYLRRALYPSLAFVICCFILLWPIALINIPPVVSLKYLSSFCAYPSWTLIPLTKSHMPIIISNRPLGAQNMIWFIGTTAYSGASKNINDWTKMNANDRIPKLANSLGIYWDLRNK